MEGRMGVDPVCLSNLQTYTECQNFYASCGRSSNNGRLPLMCCVLLFGVPTKDTYITTVFRERGDSGNITLAIW